MAEEWENSVKAAVQKLAEALQDAATLTVNTEYIEAASPGGSQTAPFKLSTAIHLDADSDSSVPVRRVGGVGLEVDMPLYQIHESNVKAAMEYRMRMLTTLLDALNGQLR